MQHTISSPISMSGIGLHSGKPVEMTIMPADADSGIVFRRVDMDADKNEIPARFDSVKDTKLCTLIANDHDAKVGTIEHLMAALRGCGVDNAIININAPEVPVMDGSSKPFVDAIVATGLKAQDAPRRAIKILKEFTVQDGDKFVTLSPSNVPVFKMRIQFDHKDIQTQDYALRLVNGNFKHDVADCRTFGFERDVAAMRAAGLAKGGSFENAIILSDDGVMNPEGLRCTDEFVRHKILDAVGDLYLAGGPILGEYRGHKAGHALNNAILHALFADASRYEMVDLMEDIDESEQVIIRPSNTRHLAV